MKMLFPKSFLFACILLCIQPVSALVVLQYHHISKEAPPSTSITPELFAAHLDFIESNNLRVIDVSELKSVLSGKSGLPDGTVIITFDDAYRSVYKTAYPMLKKRGWPFVVFINSRAQDEKNPRYIQWEQLREMAKNGATIANHTDSHHHMIREKMGETQKEWLVRQGREIDFAEKRIKKEIGASSKLFAYPYGEYNFDLKYLLKKKGYIAFGQQSGPVAKSSDAQLIPRFPFGGVYGEMQDFSTKVFSVPLPLSKVEISSKGSSMFAGPELPVGVDKPVMKITTPLARYLKNFQCFASGQGKIKTTVHSSTIVVEANSALRPGRSRYNCSANVGNGRYYWYSQMFIKRNLDGSWYSE